MRFLRLWPPDLLLFFLRGLFKNSTCNYEKHHNMFDFLLFILGSFKLKLLVFKAKSWRVNSEVYKSWKVL